MNENHTTSNPRPTWSMAFRDRRGRFDPKRYRSHGAWLAYIGFGATLLFGVPALVYMLLIAGSLVTIGFAISLTITWLLYGLMTDAVLSRSLATWPEPSHAEMSATI